MADYRVRCPKCGSTIPADVNFCSSCGAGLNDDLLILEEANPPAGRPASPWSTPHARAAGSRSPWLAVGAGVALVALVGLVLHGRHHVARPPVSHPAAAPLTTVSAPTVPTTVPVTTTTTLFAPGATRTVVYVAGTSVVERVDLDAGTFQNYDLSAAGQALTTDGLDVGVAVVGDRVIVQQGGNTIALPASLIGPPVALGPSVGFLPSLHPGRVWLVSVPATGPVVREVDTSGRPTSAPSALPQDWQPTAAVTSGLLLTNSLGFEVWDPVANRVGYRSPAQATVVAAAGAQVAWQLSSCAGLCALHLTNLSTGASRAVYPQPPEVSGLLQSGAFSPDGRYLAAGAYGPSGGVLAIVDLQTQQTQSVPQVADGSFTPTWSPSGQWLFVVASSSIADLYVLQRGTTTFQTVVLRPPASGNLTVAAAPSSQ